MITTIIPKLPMRNKAATMSYYKDKLGFEIIGDYEKYFLASKDNSEIHFFEFEALDPTTNYGQVYIRTNDINTLYQSLQNNGVNIHPNGHLQVKPWGQREFSLLDPDNNLLTFGQVHLS